jgi:hypothetical protein
MAGVPFKQVPACPKGCIILPHVKVPQVGSKCPKCQSSLTKTVKGGGVTASGTVEYRPLAHFAKILHANPETTKKIVKQNAVIRATGLSNRLPRYITDIAHGAMMKKVLEQVPDFGDENHPYDLLLATNSDATDIIEDQQKSHKTHAYMIYVEPLSLPTEDRATMRNSYPLIETGPNKTDITTIWPLIVEDAIKVAQGVKVHVAAVKEEKEVRIFVGGVKGDTFELVALGGLVGATGRLTCLYCDFPGVQKGTTYYPVHYAPVDDSTELRGDHAGLPGIDNDPPPIVPKERTCKDLDAAVHYLRNPPEGSTVADVRITTGVSARSCLRDLPLFAILFPYFIFLDLMHLRKHIC